eukprot:Selendium_serpulae@DN6073_c0_g2_i1.p1
MTTNSIDAVPRSVSYTTFEPLIDTVAADFDFKKQWLPSARRAMGVMLASLLNSILHQCQTKVREQQGTVESNNTVQGNDLTDGRSAAIISALQPKVLRSAIESVLLPKTLREGALEAADREGAWLGKTSAAPLRSQFDGRHSDFLRKLESEFGVAASSGSGTGLASNVSTDQKSGDDAKQKEHQPDVPDKTSGNLEDPGDDLNDTGFAYELSTSAYGVLAYLTTVLEYIVTEMVMEVFEEVENPKRQDNELCSGIDDATVIAAIAGDPSLARQFLTTTISSFMKH